MEKMPVNENERHSDAWRAGFETVISPYQHTVRVKIP